MLDKLEAIQQRFNDVSEQLTHPDVMSDMKRFKTLNKEYKDLNKIVVEYKAYQNVLANIQRKRGDFDGEGRGLPPNGEGRAGIALP